MNRNINSHIVLLTEGGIDVGMGHVIRCSRLLQLLKRPFELSVVSCGASLIKYFPKATHKSVDSWLHINWSHFNFEKVDFILCDIPIYKECNWFQFRYKDAIVIAIDDHGGMVPADIIFNGTVMPEYHVYENVEMKRTFYIGSKYSLVHPIFSSTPWTGLFSGILTILIGSGDDARNWILNIISHRTERFAAAKVNLIIGNAFTGFTELESLCKLSDVSLFRNLEAYEVAHLFSTSEVALVTAGTGLYEAVATGVPVVAFPQIMDLCPQATWFSERGACHNLTINQPSPNSAILAVNTLINSPEDLLFMSTCQNSCFDGQGMIRVASILDQLLGDLN